MTDRTVNFKITADTSDLKAGINSAKDQTKEVEKETDNVSKKQTKWIDQFKAFGKQAGGSFGKIGGAVDDIGKRFKSAGSMGKLALAGAIIAVVAVVAKVLAEVAKKLYNFAKEASTLADPVAAEESANRLNNSINRMKSALGNILKPIYEGINWIIGGIADGITSIVEGVLYAVGYIKGLLGMGQSVNKTLDGTADAMSEVNETANAGLASFDKLNTLGDINISGIKESERVAELMEKARQDGAQAVGDMKNLLGGLGGIWDTFANAGRSAWSAIQSAGQSVWNGLKSVASGIWEAMTQAFNTVFNVISSIIEKLKGMVDAIINPLKSVSGGATDFLGNAWNGIKGVFGAASGAVIAPNNPHPVIVGDNKREAEIISPLSTIEQAVINALGRTSGGTSENIRIEIPINLDGRTIALASYDYIKAESRRRGTSL